MFAWRVLGAPTVEAVKAGCPVTGWVHEARPPWRVIVFDTFSEAERIRGRLPFTIEKYDGTEDIRSGRDWLAKP